MGKGKIVGGGNAFKVTNGRMVEELSQSEVIPPYTFIQSDSWTTQPTPVVKNMPFVATQFECETISSNQFLLVYPESTKIHHRIVTLNGDNLTFGTDVVFTYSEYVDNFALTKITDNKFIISFSFFDSRFDDGRLLHYVVTISGATITLGTILETHSNERYISGYTTTKISNSRIMVTYKGTYSTKLSSVTFLQISGNTLTRVSTPTIDVGTYVPVKFQLISSTNYLCIAKRDSSSDYLYASVFTISGDSVTVGTWVSVGSGVFMDLTQIANSKFITSYGYKNSQVSDYSYTRILAISGKTVTTGGEVSITGIYYNGYVRNALFDTSTIVQINANTTTCYNTYKISGNNLTPSEKNTQISTKRADLTYVCVLNGKIVAIMFDNSSYTHSGQYAIFVPKTQHSGVKPSTGTILGITQTKVTPTQKGKVWYYNK